MTTVDYRAFLDETSTVSYLAYQQRFHRNPRKCDIVLADILEGLNLGDGVRLLDVGCAGGHAIHYLSQRFPDWLYIGIDIREDAIKAADAIPTTAAVGFALVDLFSDDMPERPYDVVTESSAFYPFTFDEFEEALHRVRRLLPAGGYAILFDAFHPWEQQLECVERTVNHPGGHRLCVRPYRWTREAADRAGFEVLEFRPFRELTPEDAPKPVDPFDLRTWVDDHGTIMRGSMGWPLHHLVMRAR